MGMFDKSSVPAAPNTSAISGAQTSAGATAATNSANQLAWAQGANATDQATADKAVNGSLTQQDALNAQSGTDLNTYNSTATPALGTLQTDANNYSNPGFKDQQVGSAIGAVTSADDAARNNSTQQLESFGVNPASTRMGALDLQTRVQQGADEAAAGTNMGQTVDATGRALQQQVFADASGVGAAGVNESNAGTSAGNTAVGEQNAATTTGGQVMGTAPQYAAIQGSDLSGAAGTENQAYANTINATQVNNASSSGIGSALGAAAGIGLGVAGLKVPGGGSLGGNYLSSATGGPVVRAAVGGAIPGATPGGAVPAGASPTGGQGTDDVPARLTVGEYVIPKDVVAWKGQEHFQKTIDKAREDAAQATAKPAVGNAPPQRPTFASTPQQGAIPARRAA